TPEATEIQRFLRKAVTAGCSHAVMEVSSVAIDLHRVSALTFDTAIFSNLTQDHLDYHKTMEAYFDAKQRLFDGRLRPQPHNLVLNLDDAFGERLFRETNGAARKISYGIGNVAERNLDVGVEQYEVTGHGLVLDVHTVAGRFELKSFLIGRPHVYNLLASTAAALAVGIAPEAIVAGVAVAQVPGRFERVDDGSHGFTVVVDYAHTPDAIVNALGAARAIVEPHNGRVVTVFGCGGDRDRGKRPLMAEAAATHSDIIIATSDNPRNESPEQILDDVEIGLRRVGKPFHRFVDRRQAIGCAIEQARPGDLVVIAGKGHETYQILGPTTIHFDDREVAREALDGLKAEASYAHS
ncbi:MAG: UDP-N-acetylmuramoyl-L-alanyl-D-glutamate--2,6-diaminopimelate ligase, partial [Blastocatellia bacterium]|nr:UDP-N-acetylmuramoyl-L-alanyl-D-glutamate--2,6-diaminopimelate ligase [Blastocatellia bacterium]